MDELTEQINAGDEPIDDFDRLASRVLDGEAIADDVDQFASMLREEAELKRFLELQASSAALQRALDADLSRLSAIDLPFEGAASGAPALRFVRATGVVLTLAAALALAFIFVFSERQEPGVRMIDLDQAQPHVLGEHDLGDPLDPMLTHSRQLPDGRWEVTIIERRLRRLLLDEFDESWLREGRPDQMMDAGDDPKKSKPLDL